MSAQWTWLSRWKGMPPHTMLDPHQFPNLAAIQTSWQNIERDTREFVATLGESDLARVIRYINMEDEEWAYPLWQQMIHQVNHAIQHRSEVAVILTEFDHSPGSLDLLYFIDQQAG